ncbi:hypothetical protein BT93_L4706 [Corymbia citriodora subsp. variegata]|uniref:ELM2 domain-containing protein n=1 Tax=Corymbia citriodora subsp. variegata TaxID=360336 RepID=A0A8T0CXS7_CORYI|nr:hypothetical protein BT93_L4706 [Corymbia citriodora subsp. variegata]
MGIVSVTEEGGISSFSSNRGGKARWGILRILMKKRKLDQSLESEESTVDHGQALEKNLHHNVKKLVTTLSCVTNFADIIGDSLDEQTVHNSCIASTGVSTGIEGYEEKQSTNSYPAPSAVDFVSSLVVIDSISWSRQDLAPRNQPSEDPGDETDDFNFSDADEESNVMVRRRVFSLLYLDDEYPTRPVVPIGPAFQAEIPIWMGTCTKNYNTSESTKYIGTRIWPVEDGVNETLLGSNGQGRHELCSCKSPGSANCMKRHVYESTLNFKLNLGPAFWTWKFNEMGGEVSRTWTMREENQFETLVKTNPLVNQPRFWDKALKCIPTKSKDNILRY